MIDVKNLIWGLKFALLFQVFQPHCPNRPKPNAQSPIVQNPNIVPNLIKMSNCLKSHRIAQTNEPPFQPNTSPLPLPHAVENKILDVQWPTSFMLVMNPYMRLIPP